MHGNFYRIKPFFSLCTLPPCTLRFSGVFRGQRKGALEQMVKTPSEKPKA